MHFCLRPYHGNLNWSKESVHPNSVDGTGKYKLSRLAQFPRKKTETQTKQKPTFCYKRKSFLKKAGFFSKNIKKNNISVPLNLQFYMLPVPFSEVFSCDS